MFKSRAITMAALMVAAATLFACAKPAPPPPPPPPAPAPIPGPQSVSERTLLTMAADLAFPPGSWTLKKQGKAKLDEVVPSFAGMLPGSKIVVYGYTDNKPVGKDLKRKGIEDNLDLSSKRANEVVRYLTSKGIDPNIISAKGRGDTHPVASNDTPQGRAQNRRIEVVAEQPTR